MVVSLRVDASRILQWGRRRTCEAPVLHGPMLARLLVSLLLVGVTGCARASRADAGSSTPALDELLTLRTPSGEPPGFPPTCARKGTVAFVAVAPLRTLDLNLLAERYRRLFKLEVEVLPAVAATKGALNIVRQQYAAKGLIDGMYGALGVATDDTSRWIVGVTDADLYWPEKDWRYCFSFRSEHGAIVSTARTQPATALKTAERTFKLITRTLGEGYCGLQRGGPDDSVLRPTMMGVEDLDLIDESVWIPAPLIR